MFRTGLVPPVRLCWFSTCYLFFVFEKVWRKCSPQEASFPLTVQFNNFLCLVSFFRLYLQCLLADPRDNTGLIIDVPYILHELFAKAEILVILSSLSTHTRCLQSSACLHLFDLILLCKDCFYGVRVLWSTDLMLYFLVTRCDITKSRKTAAVFIPPPEQMVWISPFKITTSGQEMWPTPL